MTNLQELVDLLQDDDEDVRRKALDALIATGSETPIPHILAALADPGRWVRMAAIGGVSKLKVREAIPTLVGLLKDPNRWGRGMAAEALADLGETSAVPAIVEAYRAEGDEGCRGYFKRALTELADSQATEVYLELLHSSDRWDQEQAIRALEKVPDRRAIPRLLELLRSPGDLHRYDIIDLLVVLGAKEKEAVAEIEKATRDRHPLVRQGAVQALGVLGRERSKRALRRALRDRDLDIKMQAARSLAALGEPGQALKSLDRLCRPYEKRLARHEELALADISAVVRIAAALAELGDPERAVELLQDLDRRPEQRNWPLLRRSAWQFLSGLGITIPPEVFERPPAEDS